MAQNLRRQFREIPVYVFTGFLGAGKTTFIQDTLASPDFDDGTSTLLLICEDGEVEYDPKKFKVPNVSLERISDIDDLNLDTLVDITKRVRFDKVMVEYNGMWQIADLYASMPGNWVIAQEMCFMDATTFMLYNKNMRQQCFDKMQTCEMLVFNRCEKGFDKEAFHKEARIANRNSIILYEYGPTDVEIDNIDDPLPFDKEKNSIVIEDDWYAEWYRDINEKENDYDGKTLTFKGMVALADELPDGRFAIGRHVMTCCVQDIQFAGLMCVYSGAVDFKNGDWVKIKAKVRIEYDEAYGEKGPVLYCKSLEQGDPPDPEVATF